MLGLDSQQDMAVLCTSSFFPTGRHVLEHLMRKVGSTFSSFTIAIVIRQWFFLQVESPSNETFAGFNGRQEEQLLIARIMTADWLFG